MLEIGCGTGELLAAVAPSYGLGVDISPKMIEIAGNKFPGLNFRAGDIEDLESLNINDTFDYIILADTVGILEDVQKAFEKLHLFCHETTRIIVTYYNFLWEPILRLAEFLGLKTPTKIGSWLTPRDIENLLYLADMEVIKKENRLPFPKKIPYIHILLEFIGSLPVFNRLCISNYLVARPLIKKAISEDKKVSVIIPTKNEKGNIERAVRRLPALGSHTEIIFIDGHSADGTQEEIRRVMDSFPDLDIIFLIQNGKGKGDAVRKAFDHAAGEILMILDADLTVDPEDLPKFYNAIASGKGEFINGSRLVYLMEKQAMRTLNIMGNKFFSFAFSWLLNQHIKDTLCGTKVLSRDNYKQIASGRDYFGNFDPFGDFDLLFGASKLNLKIIEIPIRYKARQYGETQISRFRHGLLLLKMCLFAIGKLKLIKHNNNVVF